MSWPRLCCTTGGSGGFVGEKAKEEGWVGGGKLVGLVVGEYTETGLPKDRFDEGAGIS